MDYNPRKLEEKLDNWMNREEILLIKGPRQSGKTTLLKHLRDKYGGTYVTLEDEDALYSFDKSPKEFIKRFDDNKIYIDEAQYCEKVGKTLKFFYDSYQDKKFVVTGSGSFDIKVEVGKYLVGRGIYFELFPLDFEEFLMWKARDLHKIFIDYKRGLTDFILEQGKIDATPAFGREFMELTEEFILFGGFPAIVKEDDEEIKKQLLKNLVRTYIEKDVFFFFDIRHLEKFRNLLSYMSFNIGSLMEISSISAELDMDYRTIENDISILSQTYVIYMLSPFHRNLSTELKKSKKLYFIDTGLRNSILNNFIPLKNRLDRGHLFENFIFEEILKNIDGKINYWRTTGKAEVDFILGIDNKLIPIEVKSQPGLSRGFLSFLKAYKPRRAVVFNEKEFSIRKIGNTDVAFVPYFYI